MQIRRSYGRASGVPQGRGPWDGLSGKAGGELDLWAKGADLTCAQDDLNRKFCTCEIYLPAVSPIISRGVSAYLVIKRPKDAAHFGAQFLIKPFVELERQLTGAGDIVLRASSAKEISYYHDTSSEGSTEAPRRIHLNHAWIGTRISRMPCILWVCRYHFPVGAAASMEARGHTHKALVDIKF
jgi:hypothetical protein